ncbi:polar amino acid transport system substrate-binding protein [Alloyangia pacifica]|uniref:Polar amino acid transport system substrate-binding protein n=1 Tax=Alloyangia pacifica TaxID=311180 RepID=A0A1I6WD65_9RHOB|nr:transporter substrate-binding domain-containing protein [Alloyangia pacifica]SDI59919.1 polar amino acid transport system substrate-binding protein [Alloyangia pacifica]SFT23940.1 polar amino acid transport system substrate-binding protein [Alloyangia pacifica]
MSLDHSASTAPLRVALNHGNFVLVGRDEDGQAKGISVDLARAYATARGREVVFVEYNRAVDVSSSASDDEWDVCFLAVDPERAKTIAFTEPYVRIEGSYLAGPVCEAADANALVASGQRVGSVRGSAYSLTLQRKPGAEHLQLYETLHLALEAMDRGEVRAAAGIRQAMEHEASTRPGSRVLTPPFMEIRQAMAMPQGRPEASADLQAFLTEALRDGTVGDILERHGVSRDCAIIPS